MSKHYVAHTSLHTSTTASLSYTILYTDIRLWTTVYKMVRHMLAGRCLSCLSVTLVYCGQTVGWIKVILGMEVATPATLC